MTGRSDRNGEGGHGLLMVAQAPTVLRVGASWIVIAQWADAGRELFGRSWVSTPNELLSPADALSFGTATSKGREDVAAWRRRIPEAAVTAIKDARTALRAWRASRVLGALPPDCNPPFVLQHHALFQRRGRLVADRLGVPLVIGVESLQVREASSWGVRRPGWGWLVERLGEQAPLRRADLVMTLSESTAAQLREFLPADRVLVTPLRADLEAYDGVDPETAKANLDCGSSFVIGWLGSFRPFHALDVILGAFELLLDAVPDAVLVLVGDGPERGRCDEFAARIGRDRVRLTGMLSFDAVPDVIAAFDVAVIGARQGESFHYSPLKLQEYLAAGIPVVGPDAGQVVDVLGDGRAGRTYPPGDATALAAHLVELAGNASLRGELAAAAKVVALELGTAADQLRRVCDRLGVDSM